MAYNNEFNRLSIILHSWELLIALWLAVVIFRLGVFWISLAIGFSQHMFFDLIFNSGRLKTHFLYFLVLRVLNKFNQDKFLHQKKKDRVS